ncbi:late embryogenesis abundant protein At1g64065-like [Olea europaea var. sylvestris]|uniref:late embryogenesis abundant protein At1g64065-like n=1 Tax=Olea europaea var. sylvestris TaxID=158386 RepID=UPI000C1D8178|nr:late embryogenesis abundant protein At1g64065-like [Olea europaea var. sylvestris]
MAVESFNSNNANSTSIDMQLLTQISVKNTNFGHFKYDNSTLTILYNGMPVGEAVIPRGRAKARKTQKFNISVGVSSDRLSGNTNLGNDMNSEVIRLSSHAKLSGKVHLMKVIKKKKSGEMNCDWTINLATRQVQDLKCK